MSGISWLNYWSFSSENAKLFDEDDKLGSFRGGSREEKYSVTEYGSESIH